MKKLFIIMTVMLLTMNQSCTKQIDCDQVKSTCTYILFNLTDCTPENGGFDHVKSDTIITTVTGCPDKIEQNFESDQNKIINDPNTSKFLREGLRQFPSKCNCY